MGSSHMMTKRGLCTDSDGHITTLQDIAIQFLDGVQECIVADLWQSSFPTYSFIVYSFVILIISTLLFIFLDFHIIDLHTIITWCR